MRGTAGRGSQFDARALIETRTRKLPIGVLNAPLARRPLARRSALESRLTRQSRAGTFSGRAVYLGYAA
jgi:hypothetical protein